MKNCEPGIQTSYGPLHLPRNVNLPPMGSMYGGETYYRSSLENRHLNHGLNLGSEQVRVKYQQNIGNQERHFETECGHCKSLARKSSQLQLDLETNKVLLEEKEDQIADLLAGIDAL